MNTVPFQYQRVYWVAALGLLVIALAAFNIIYPLNAAPSDDWSVFYQGYTGDLQQLGVNRYFGFLPRVILEWVIPGNVPSHGMLYVLSMWASAVLLFHIAYKLMQGQALFALLIASVFLLYIPENPQHGRMFYLNVGYWTLLSTILSITLLIEGMSRTGRGAWWLTLSSIPFAVFAASSFEAALPMLAGVVFLLVLLPDPITRRKLLLLSVWGIGPLVSALIFLNTVFFNIEGSYQSSFVDTDALSPGFLASSMSMFYRASFPVFDSLQLSANYLLPAVGLGGLVTVLLILMWRIQSTLPSYRVILVAFIIGLLYVGLGGIAWSLSGFPDGVFPRMHFMAQPGQGITYASGVMLIVVLVNRRLRLSPLSILLPIMLIFSMAAGHWFFAAQQFAERVNRGFRTYDQHLEFYQDIVSLVPSVREPTLLILDCPAEPVVPKHVWTDVSTLGAMYLYEHVVRIDRASEIEFLARETLWRNHFTDEQVTFPYERTIVLQCVGEAVRIAETFPEHLITEGMNTSGYQPYRLIQRDYFTPQQTRIFSW